MVSSKYCGPGHFAPARFFYAAAIALALVPAAGAEAQTRGRLAPAPAQQQPAPARPAVSGATLPVPDNLVTSKLLWSTMAALDHASDTANFTVVRDLGSAVFRAKHNPASLAAIFATLRNQRVDLADTLLVAPTFELAPHMVTPTAFRMRGTFPMRPTAVAFDLIYSWEGAWRLDAIAVLPIAPPAGR